jgi:hypothetical protein
MNNSIIPFWNEKSDQISKNIWNPEDYKQELVKNENFYSVEHYHPQMVNNKILSKNHNQISEEMIISRKIRFYPTKKQKVHLNKYLSAHRYFYNKTIEEINRRYDNRKEEFSSHPTCVFCSSYKDETSWTCSEHKNKPLPWNIKIKSEDLRPIVVKNNNVITSIYYNS